MFENKSPRMQGVRTPEYVSTEQLPTRTLTNVVPAQMYGVQFGDDSGKAHTAVVIKIGDQWYMPPNAEEWAGKLKPLASWLVKQLDAKAQASKDFSVPKEDTVEVMG